MNSIGATEQPGFRAGYRFYQWGDARRQRPVWVDVWYPAHDESSEQPISYSLAPKIRGFLGTALRLSGGNEIAH